MIVLTITSYGYCISVSAPCGRVLKRDAVTSWSGGLIQSLFSSSLCLAACIGQRGGGGGGVVGETGRAGQSHSPLYLALPTSTVPILNRRSTERPTTDIPATLL